MNETCSLPNNSTSIYVVRYASDCLLQNVLAPSFGCPAHFMEFRRQFNLIAIGPIFPKIRFTMNTASRESLTFPTKRNDRAIKPIRDFSWVKTGRVRIDRGVLAARAHDHVNRQFLALAHFRTSFQPWRSSQSNKSKAQVR